MAIKEFTLTKWEKFILKQTFNIIHRICKDPYYWHTISTNDFKFNRLFMYQVESFLDNARATGKIIIDNKE